MERQYLDLNLKRYDGDHLSGLIYTGKSIKYSNTLEKKFGLAIVRDCMSTLLL